MEKYIPVLQGCPLFADIHAQDLPGMLQCLGAQILSYQKGQLVFHEGAPATHLGIVLEGAVQILRDDYYGNRSILGRAAAGDLFCESFACAGVTALPVNVMVTQDCQILRIDSCRILRSCSNACEFHNQLIMNLMQVMAEKNLAFHEKVQILSQRTTRDKLMTYLMLCSEKERSSDFEIPFDRQELADYLEVERSGLSAEIGKLKKEGIIECEKNRFTLL